MQKDDPVDFNELTFSTLPPSVVSVAVDDQTVSQTGATVTVTVKEPNGTAQVHIRYSTESNFPSGSTETESKVVPTTTNSNGEDTIDFVLTGLSASSSYYVEASYDSAFPDSDATESTDFTTDPPDPAVSSVEVLDSGSDEITQTGAKIRVHVTNPDGTDDVHIRYSTDSSFGQGSTIVTDSATPGTSDTYVDFIARRPHLRHDLLRRKPPTTTPTRQDRRHQVRRLHRPIPPTITDVIEASNEHPDTAQRSRSPS